MTISSAESRAIAALIAGLLFPCLTFAESPALGSAAGRAVSVEGKVLLRHGSRDEALVVGMPVEAGDWLSSERGGSARILFSDQTILDLGPQSRLEIKHWATGSDHRESELQLDFGRVRNSINQKLGAKDTYKIRTKVSAFAVRGTDFYVEAGANTLMTVFEGKVLTSTLKEDKSLLVPAGSRILATPAGLGKIGKLRPIDLQGVLSRARVDDRTFAQAVVVGDPSRSRSFGASTLRVLSGSGKVAPVKAPASDFNIPGIVLPNATLVSGSLQNYYPVQVTVTFK